MMATYSQIALQLNAQGQLVVPIDLQAVLSLQAGDTLIISIENNKLVLEKPVNVKQKLKNRFAALTASLADELIQERQQSAQREL